MKYFSVVVVAYNRRIFLLDALRSAVNQTLNKRMYEIIVLKNFDDSSIDKYIKTNKIKSIKVNNPLKQFFGLLDKFHGKYIAILEDDDLWTKDRLKRARDILRKTNAEYYHNSSISIFDDVKINSSLLSRKQNDARYYVFKAPYKDSLKENFCKFNIHLNDSSIIIKKTALKSFINQWNKTRAYFGFDFFLAFSTIDNHLTIIHDTAKTTIVRQHFSLGSAFQINPDKFEEIVERNQGIIKMYSTFDSEISKLVLSKLISFMIIDRNINAKVSRLKMLSDYNKHVLRNKYQNKSAKIRQFIPVFIYMINKNLAKKYRITRIRKHKIGE